MKKILTLTAVALAACGAAHAQSAVTLYGIVDVNVSNYAAGNNSTAGNVTKMNDGVVNGLNGSRVGFKAVENLSSDLTASTVLEMGLAADTGMSTQGGRAFGRQAFLSLASKSAGELRLGRQYTFGDGVLAMTNPFGNAMQLNPGLTQGGMTLWYDPEVRWDNTAQYTTPTFGGFSAGVQVAPGEGTANRKHSAKVGYSGNGLNVAVSYEWQKDRTTGDKVGKSTSLAANYTFGTVKVLGGLQSNREVSLAVVGANAFTATKSDVITLGVEAAVTPTVSLGTNYTLAKLKNNTNDEKVGRFALGARYGFSKQTFAYASASFGTGDTKEYHSDKRVLQVGLRKMF